MSYALRTLLPKILTGIVAGLAIGAFFLNIPELTAVNQLITTWATIVVTFAIFLGLFALVEFHYRSVANRKKDEWQYSLFTLSLLVITTIIALVLSTDSDSYQTIWFYFNGWPYLITLGIQGLYQISASFRSMRARSVESSIVLILTFIVVLAQMPLATIYLPQFGSVSDWLLKYANSGALSGITIGLGVGAVVLGYRLLFGKEKTLTIEPEKGG